MCMYEKFERTFLERRIIRNVEQRITSDTRVPAAHPVGAGCFIVIICIIPTACSLKGKKKNKLNKATQKASLEKMAI